MPDLSKAAAFIGIDPSTRMLVLVFLLGFLGLAYLVLKNSKVQDGIVAHLSAKTSDGAIEKLTVVVEEIREGQKVSNAERKAQAVDIAQLKQDVTENKFDTLTLTREVHRIRIAMKLPATADCKEG